MPRRKPDPAGWLRPFGPRNISYGANILDYFWSILVEHHADYAHPLPRQRGARC